MRVTAIQIAAIARPVHAATQLLFSAGDATGRSARSDVGDRNGPLIANRRTQIGGMCNPRAHVPSGSTRPSRRRSGDTTRADRHFGLVDDLRPDILAALRERRGIRGPVRYSGSWPRGGGTERRDALFPPEVDEHPPRVVRILLHSVVNDLDVLTVEKAKYPLSQLS